MGVMGTSWPLRQSRIRMLRLAGPTWRGFRQYPMRTSPALSAVYDDRDMNRHGSSGVRGRTLRERIGGARHDRLDGRGVVGNPYLLGRRRDPAAEDPAQRPGGGAFLLQLLLTSATGHALLVWRPIPVMPALLVAYLGVVLALSTASSSIASTGRPRCCRVRRRPGPI